MMYLYWKMAIYILQLEVCGFLHVCINQDSSVAIENQDSCVEKWFWVDQGRTAWTPLPSWYHHKLRCKNGPGRGGAATSGVWEGQFSMKESGCDYKIHHFSYKIHHFKHKIHHFVAYNTFQPFQWKNPDFLYSRILISHFEESWFYN